MKKNMRRVLYALVCLIMCMVMYAQGKSPVLSGAWSFFAPDVPYGYQSGTLKFAEKDSKLTADAGSSSIQVEFTKVSKKK